MKVFFGQRPLFMDVYFGAGTFWYYLAKVLFGGDAFGGDAFGGVATQRKYIFVMEYKCKKLLKFYISYNSQILWSFIGTLYSNQSILFHPKKKKIKKKQKYTSNKRINWKNKTIKHQSLSFNSQQKIKRFNKRQNVETGKESEKRDLKTMTGRANNVLLCFTPEKDRATDTLRLQ